MKVMNIGKNKQTEKRSTSKFGIQRSWKPRKFISPFVRIKYVRKEGRKLCVKIVKNRKKINPTQCASFSLFSQLHKTLSYVHVHIYLTIVSLK